MLLLGKCPQGCGGITAVRRAARGKHPTAPLMIRTSSRSIDNYLLQLMTVLSVGHRGISSPSSTIFGPAVTSKQTADVTTGATEQQSLVVKRLKSSSKKETPSATDKNSKSQMSKQKQKQSPHAVRNVVKINNKTATHKKSKLNSSAVNKSNADRTPTRTDGSSSTVSMSTSLGKRNPRAWFSKYDSYFGQLKVSSNAAAAAGETISNSRMGFHPATHSRVCEEYVSHQYLDSLGVLQLIYGSPKLDPDILSRQRSAGLPLAVTQFLTAPPYRTRGEHQLLLSHMEWFQVLYYLSQCQHDQPKLTVKVLDGLSTMPISKFLDLWTETTDEDVLDMRKRIHLKLNEIMSYPEIESLCLTGSAEMQVHWAVLLYKMNSPNWPGGLRSSLIGIGEVWNDQSSSSFSGSNNNNNEAEPEAGAVTAESEVETILPVEEEDFGASAVGEIGTEIEQQPYYDYHGTLVTASSMSGRRFLLTLGWCFMKFEKNRNIRSCVLRQKLEKEWRDITTSSTGNLGDLMVLGHLLNRFDFSADLQQQDNAATADTTANNKTALIGPLRTAMYAQIERYFRISAASSGGAASESPWVGCVPLFNMMTSLCPPSALLGTRNKDQSINNNQDKNHFRPLRTIFGLLSTEEKRLGLHYPIPLPTLVLFVKYLTADGVNSTQVAELICHILKASDDHRLAATDLNALLKYCSNGGFEMSSEAAKNFERHTAGLLNRLNETVGVDDTPMLDDKVLDLIANLLIANRHYVVSCDFRESLNQALNTAKNVLKLAANVSKQQQQNDVPATAAAATAPAVGNIEQKQQKKNSPLDSLSKQLNKQNVIGIKLEQISFLLDHNSSTNLKDGEQQLQPATSSVVSSAAAETKASLTSNDASSNSQNNNYTIQRSVARQELKWYELWVRDNWEEHDGLTFRMWKGVIQSAERLYGRHNVGRWDLPPGYNAFSFTVKAENFSQKVKEGGGPGCWRNTANSEKEFVGSLYRHQQQSNNSSKPIRLLPALEARLQLFHQLHYHRVIPVFKEHIRSSLKSLGVSNRQQQTADKGDKSAGTAKERREKKMDYLLEVLFRKYDVSPTRFINVLDGDLSVSSSPYDVDSPDYKKVHNHIRKSPLVIDMSRVIRRFHSPDTTATIASTNKSVKTVTNNNSNSKDSNSSNKESSRRCPILSSETAGKSMKSSKSSKSSKSKPLSSSTSSSFDKIWKSADVSSSAPADQKTMNPQSSAAEEYELNMKSHHDQCQGSSFDVLSLFDHHAENENRQLGDDDHAAITNKGGSTTTAMKENHVVSTTTTTSLQQESPVVENDETKPSVLLRNPVLPNNNDQSTESAVKSSSSSGDTPAENVASGQQPPEN